MAVVKDFYLPSGVHVTVKDDAYAGITAEEMERRQQNIQNTLNNIVREKRRKELEGA